MTPPLLGRRGALGESGGGVRRSTGSIFGTRRLSFMSLLCVLLFLLSNLGGVAAQIFASPLGNNIPLTICNNCGDTIWPGIGTQNGVGPGIGGFEQGSGNCTKFLVSWDWQGRVWGRTNCSFNANGTGPSNPNGVNGYGASCGTGDCMGVLDCQYTGAPPATLFEANCRGGQNHTQAFYDLSLVDGYNLPMGVMLNCTSPNVTDIPPNLTNPSCIATAGYLEAPARSGDYYSNTTYPIPWETQMTNDNVGGWCPWDLQVYPPSRPGNGVYPYPDSDIQRPVFDPCLSACAEYNDDADCCTGDYDNPSKCSPSLYSQQAKSVCPDAYSYAFDDQTSTFIVPAGCGYVVTFCPEGRSSNIIDTFGPQMQSLAASGYADSDVLSDTSNNTYIETHGNGATGLPRPGFTWVSLVVMAGAMSLGGLGA